MRMRHKPLSANFLTFDGRGSFPKEEMTLAMVL
jgi:hypothetical protein